MTYRSLALVFFLILSSIIYIFDNSSVVCLITASLLTLLAAYSCKFKVADPMLWWISALYIYGFSGVILDLAGYYNIKSEETPSIFLLSLMASIWGILIFNLFNVKIAKFNDMHDKKSEVTAKTMYFIALALIALALFFQYFIFSGINKTQAALLGLNRMEIFNSFYAVAFGLYLFTNKKLNQNNSIMIFGILVSLFSSLVNGERDLFASVVLISLSYLTARANISPIKMIALVCAGLLVFTVLQNYRNLFSTGEIYGTFTRPLWVEVLDGEPMSAFKNLDVLLSKASYFKSQSSFLSSDILSIFVPKFIYYIENSSIWFNKTFFPDVYKSGGGVGFTLIGSFFLYGGLASVALLSFMLSIFINFLYKVVKYNRILLPAYIAGVTTIVFSVRADISVTLGGPLRGILPSMVIFFILRKFLYPRGGRKKYAASA